MSAKTTKPGLVDRFGRSMNYLRISVTDRCNLRCRYCAPHRPEYTEKGERLSFGEMYRLVRIAVGLGITKVRLTGGEPLRFIEYMPIGTQSLLPRHYFLAIPEIKIRLERLGPLLPVERNQRDGPAELYQYFGAKGKIGFIGSMSSHFCESCNRLRLTSAGHLRPCLLVDEKLDVLGPMRNGASDEDLEELFLQAVAIKRREHHLTFTSSIPVKSQMVSIGG